jgi:outer membrane protein OmpA-like peptidoglycan-associated protein
VLAQVAENAKKGKVAKITCVGHTDRSGSEAYNMGLSQRRANNVKAELVRLGLSAKEIATVAKGEANPLVPTKDGVREAQNRRVEIMFGKAGA